MTNAVQLSQFAGVSPSWRNRIINGAMVIDQRNAGASVTPTANAYTLDRWLANVTTASKYSVQQSSVAPAGFVNSMLITSTSAYTVAASDYEAIQQRIEANNMSDIGWGTVNAQAVTLSFWVRSSLTGTFGGSLYVTSSTTRTYPFIYTINSANTWEYKTVAISGDTLTNTAPTGTNLYVIVQWSLGIGSTYTTGTSGWQNGNYACPTGCTNLVGTNGATFYITGVQLEKGSTATPFEYRDYGRELQMCQRYYQVCGINWYCYVGSGTVSQQLTYVVQPRATPTLTKLTGTSVAVSSEIGFESVSIYSARYTATFSGVNGGIYNGSFSCAAEL